MKNRILIAYFCTENLRSDFERTLRLQRRIFNIDGLYDKIVVSQSNLGGLVNIWSEAITAGGHLNPSVARNISLEAAKAGDYDAVFLCDCDVVLLEPMTVPIHGFHLAYAYNANEAEMAEEKFLLTDRTKWSPGSWFVVPKAAYDLRFSEEYIDYFGEDIDYIHNVLVPNNFICRETAPKVIRLWHPERARHNPANKHLLARRLIQFNTPEHLQHKVKKWADAELWSIIEQQQKAPS